MSGCPAPEMVALDANHSLTLDSLKATRTTFLRLASGPSTKIEYGPLGAAAAPLHGVRLPPNDVELVVRHDAKQYCAAQGYHVVGAADPASRHAFPRVAYRAEVSALPLRTGLPSW